MTPEQQEMLDDACAAKASGFEYVEIAPEDLIALLDRIAELERENAALAARVKPIVRRVRDEVDLGDTDE